MELLNQYSYVKIIQKVIEEKYMKSIYKKILLKEGKYFVGGKRVSVGWLRKI